MTKQVNAGVDGTRLHQKGGWGHWLTESNSLTQIWHTAGFLHKISWPTSTTNTRNKWLKPQQHLLLKETINSPNSSHSLIQVAALQLQRTYIAATQNQAKWDSSSSDTQSRLALMLSTSGTSSPISMFCMDGLVFCAGCLAPEGASWPCMPLRSGSWGSTLLSSLLASPGVCKCCWMASLKRRMRSSCSGVSFSSLADEEGLGGR